MLNEHLECFFEIGYIGKNGERRAYFYGHIDAVKEDIKTFQKPGEKFLFLLALTEGQVREIYGDKRVDDAITSYRKGMCKSFAFLPPSGEALGVKHIS